MLTYFTYTYIQLVACIVFAILLEDTASFSVGRVSLGDDHDYVHRESTEILAVYDDRTVGDLDYEDSLVEGVKVREQVYDTSEENRSVKRNSFQASGQRGSLLFNHAQHRFESMEDDDEMLFQHERRPTANSESNHQLWNISDEQQSWETTDVSLKQLFGIRWDSAKNKKFTRLSSVDDSIEDLLHEQHQTQPEHVRSKRPSGTAF